MKNRYIIFDIPNTAFLALFISLVFGISSCKGPVKNPADFPVPVNISEVKRENAVFYDTYPANVVALKEVEIRGEVSGYITGIFFNEGTHVSKGQKLYEIDRRKYAAAYDQAKANVEIAQANLARVQLDANRYIELNKKNAIAKQLLDHAMTDLQNAKLQVESANADVVKAKTDLDYSIITAPFDGTIGISQVKIGTIINPGQTLLNTISSDDPMAVDFVIDEKELGRFLDLEKKVSSEMDTTFRIVLPNNKVYRFNGKISLIDRAVDPQTGTITVRLIFANSDKLLRPGLSCNARVINENAGEQLVIPFKAVMEQMGEYFVFLVNGNKAKQTKISIGNKLGSDIIVRSGLNVGDLIVVDGIQRLHDGSLIQIGSPKNNKMMINKQY